MEIRSIKEPPIRPPKASTPRHCAPHNGESQLGVGVGREGDPSLLTQSSPGRLRGQASQALGRFLRRVPVLPRGGERASVLSLRSVWVGLGPPKTRLLCF